MLKTIRNISIVLILLAGGYYVLANYTNLLPNGFNFFKNETIMKKTPTLIEQIKEIEELISAEFYGEVYADLFTSYNDLIEEHGDNLNQISSKYIFLEEYAVKKLKVDNLSTKINTQATQLNRLDSLISYSDSTRKIYRVYLDSLQIILREVPKGKKDSDERERYTYVDKEVTKMKASLIEATNNYLEFSKKHKRIKKATTTSKKTLVKAKKDKLNFINKRNLVYIGRGHISAGFNMTKLQMSNLDTIETKSITLNLPKAQLIDTVINPWYYKNDKDSLMGYEIYINKKDKLYTNNDVMLVKQKCRKNLALSAMNKGIIDLATKNGTNAIESFFLLLDFQKVTINNDQLTIDNEEITMTNL